MIIIVDYGMGNLGSIQNMFKRIGVKALVTNNMEIIAKARKILLPGVGAFDAAMRSINSNGLRGLLDHKALVDRVPILGICLGMQLLTRGSEEGVEAGLGWIAADTRRFPASFGLKVPHMGWNLVSPMCESAFIAKLPQQSRFYFVHSYYVVADRGEDSVLRTTYGLTFDSAIQRDNIFGVQFHPEKSHKFGMRLLSNFANL